MFLFFFFSGYFLNPTPTLTHKGTDVNRAIDGDLQAYPVYQSWPGTPLPDVENNGPRATNLASCNEQSYLTIELENRYVLTKIKAWGKVGSRHCGMRIAISSTGRFDGEEKTVYDAGTTSYSDVQSVKGTSIDISDREPVTHVRWWMSRTEVDTMAYFVDIKFEGYVPENCTASPHIAVHTSSTLSYGCTHFSLLLSSSSLSHNHRLCYHTIIVSDNNNNNNNIQVRREPKRHRIVTHNTIPVTIRVFGGVIWVILRAIETAACVKSRPQNRVIGLRRVLT